MENFGSLLQKLGQHDKAIGLLEQAAIAEEVGNLGPERTRCCVPSPDNLLPRHKKQSNFTSRDSMAVFKDPEVVAIDNLRASKGLGQCLSSLGNYAQAIRQHKKQWVLSQHLNHSTHPAQDSMDNSLTLWMQALA